MIQRLIYGLVMHKKIVNFLLSQLKPVVSRPYPSALVLFARWVIFKISSTYIGHTFFPLITVRAIHCVLYFMLIS